MPLMSNRTIARPDISEVDILDIILAPQSFQYKTNRDNKGVTGILKDDTVWSPAHAGILMLMRKRDGRLYLVDGHQRYNLGIRNLENGNYKAIHVAAWIIEEGKAIPGHKGLRWTNQTAMAYAAGINIVQGSGKIMDAARVLRTYPELAPDLPNHEFARVAGKLVPLASNAFEFLLNNENTISLPHAAMVPVYLSDPEMHLHALNEIRTLNPRTLEETRCLLTMLREEGTEKLTQTTMFGDDIEQVNRYQIKLDVLKTAVRYLKRDRDLFSRMVKDADRIESVGHNLVKREACEIEATLDERALSTLLPPVNHVDRKASEKARDSSAQSLELLQRMALVSGEVNDLFKRAVGRVVQGNSIEAAAAELSETLKMHIHDFLAATPESGIAPVPVHHHDHPEQPVLC